MIPEILRTVGSKVKIDWQGHELIIRHRSPVHNWDPDEKGRPFLLVVSDLVIFLLDALVFKECRGFKHLLVKFAFDIRDILLEKF